MAVQPQLVAPPFAATGHYGQATFAQSPWMQASAPAAPPAYSPPEQPHAFHNAVAPLIGLSDQQRPPDYPQLPSAAPAAWSAEGQPSKDHAAASSPSAPVQALVSSAGGVGRCERCALIAARPDDRFCGACGGSIARGS
jgi:hypothetical protein